MAALICIIDGSTIGSLPCSKSLPSSPSILAIAIAVVLILAATKPATMRVQRAITVEAPPEKIFSADQRFSPVAELVAL